MGGAIASTLLRAGFTVIGYDRQEEPLARLKSQGGGAARSVDDLAASSDIISIVVVDDEQVRDVAGALLGRARPRTPLIVHSTIRPESIVELATRAQEHSLDVIDATVTGGAEKAALGTLTVMVGGDRTAVRRVWPVLSAIGENVFYLGPSGSGAVMKLINNLMAMGTYALALEAMSLGRAFGIGEDEIVGVLCTGAADSRVLRTWGRTDRARVEQAGSHFTDDPEKDVRSAVVAAAQRGVMLPVASTIAGTLRDKFRERDIAVDQARARGAPRCTICNQELGFPFRVAAVHPECANPLLIRSAPPDVEE
jgi:3-hydroxyisobutyrate dehydrogenase-like beta-hydroxyacid dehydrogenase